ncbi:MAG TPA: CHAD domain-containing protein [Candidatus Limnocylindrales bacterium]
MTEAEDRQDKDGEPRAAEPAASPEPTPEREPPPPPEPPRLGHPPGPIERDDPFALAGRKAMWLHVKRLLEVDAALRDPDRPHDLKRYRVATRRLRAAMRAFEDAFPRREVRELRDDLGDLAAVAGAARDLDVRIADLEAWARDRGEDTIAGVEPLAAAWQAERAAAATGLDARLRTRRHRRLLEDLVTFVESTDATGPRAGRTGSRPAAAAPARPIGLRAGTLLWQGYERLMAYDHTVRWADLATLHQLRIEAKRLRYLLEFLGDILGPEQADLVARLVAVQDHLGQLNDASVTSSAVRAFLQLPTTQLQASQRTAITAYLQDRERAIARLRRGAMRPWRGIAALVFARRLARALIAR